MRNKGGYQGERCLALESSTDPDDAFPEPSIQESPRSAEAWVGAARRY